MRMAMFLCGFALIASPVFSQSLLTAPSPKPMALRSTPQASANTKAGKQAQGQADAQLNRQVTAVQQRLQQEETRLQSQFAQLQRMRAAALEKQNQKELERLNRLEQQVVADYQKRVEQVLISAQAQIQATPVHVPDPQAQATKASRTPTRTTPTQRSRTQPTGASKAQGQKQPTRKPSKTTQRTSSSRYGWFGRR